MFNKEDNNVLIDITIELDGWAFTPGSNNVYIQGYDDTDEMDRNPSPGSFEYKYEDSGIITTITVDYSNYYGIHLNVYETGN